MTASSQKIGMLALLAALQLLGSVVVAFSTPSSLRVTTRRNHRFVLVRHLQDDDDSFPDPHDLMEYLDGPSDIDGFLSFEDYQELQRKQQYLRACPIFRDCTPEDISRIAKTMALQELQANEKLVVQGASGEAMYFLKSGSFQAIGEELEGENGNTTTTTTVYTTYSKEGSYFGELALLFGQTRAASIVAMSAAQVYRLDKAAFLESIVDSPVYETARRLVLAKYKSKNLRSALPKIKLDEVVGLVKAKLFKPRLKDIRQWGATLRTFALGACATYVVMTNYVQTAALKALVLTSMAVVAHLL